MNWEDPLFSEDPRYTAISSNQVFQSSHTCERTRGEGEELGAFPPHGIRSPLFSFYFLLSRVQSGKGELHLAGLLKSVKLPVRRAAELVYTAGVENEVGGWVVV